MAVPNMTNNAPSAGHISWDLFHIQYEGVGYEVAAGETADKWVWWRFNGGMPVIQSGPAVPDDLIADDLLLFANKSGTAVRIQNSNRIDGELIVDGTIVADALAANIISSNHIVTTGLDAAVIKFGTMNGDRIGVNTLQGDRLVANSIVASKIAVTDWNNYITDPFFNFNRWDWGLVGTAPIATTASGPLGTGSQRIVRLDAALLSTRVVSALDLFPTNSADTLRVSVWIRKITNAAAPTGNLGLRLYTYDASGASSSTAVSMLTADMVMNTWYELVIDNFVPATNRVSGQVQFSMTGVNALDDFDFGIPTVSKKRNGRLIVDGTVQANQLAADSVTTNKLAADAVTANKVAAKAIDVSKLNIGDLTNYVADGELTDPNSVNWEMNKFWPAPHMTRVDPAGAFPYFEGSTLTSRGTFFSNNHQFEVRGGDEFLIEMEISTPATNVDTLTLNIGLFCYDYDGAGMLWRVLTDSELLLPNTDWYKVSGVLKIDPGETNMAFGQFNSYIPASTTDNQKLRMRKISVRKRNGGNLIVDGGIEARNMAVDSVRAENIVAEAVTVDKIESNIIWTSEQYVGDIHIHPTQGITIPQDGTEDVTHFAADGSGNQIAGAIVANDGLTSYGGVSMQGSDNFLAGSLEAGNGVNDPSSAPTITSSYDTVVTGGGDTGGFLRKGLCMYHDDVTAAIWVTTDTVAGGSNVQSWAKAGGGGYWGFDVLSGWSALGGVTRLGNYYYVLCRQNSSPTTWRILLYYAPTRAYAGSYAAGGGTVNISTNAYPAIGNDGVNLVVAWVIPTGVLWVRRIQPVGVGTPGSQTGNTLDGGAWGATTSVQDVQVISGVCYITYSTAGLIRAYNMGSTTMTRDTSKEWATNTGAITGFEFDTTLNKWITFTSGKTFTKHTLLDGTYDFAYDWTDADTGGTGTASTKPSPIKTIKPVKFAKWNVSLPGYPPDDLTTDGANTARIFAAPTGQPLIFQHQLVTDGDGLKGKPLSIVKSFDTPLATTGVTPNVVNDFGERPGAIGKFSSSKPDGVDRMWQLSGDGSWKLGKFLKGNADGTNAMDTGWIALPLVAPFSNYGGGYDTASYRRINGIVYLKGLITQTGTAAATIATLPVGFRPAAANIYNGNANVPTGAASAGTAHTHNISSLGFRVQIGSTGVMQTSTLMQSGSHLSLSGITFPAEL